jgi:DnaJ-class molecular chaperone
MGLKFKGGAGALKTNRLRPKVRVVKASDGDDEPCHVCHGSGKDHGKTCGHCHGTGHEPDHH